MELSTARVASRGGFIHSKGGIICYGVELSIEGVELSTTMVEIWGGIIHRRGGIFNYKGCGDGVIQHFVKGGKIHYVR